MKRLIKINLRIHLFSASVMAGVFALAISGWFLYLGFQQSQIDYDVLARSEYSRKIKMQENTVSVYLSENPEISQVQKESIMNNLETQVQCLKEMINARTSGDWKSELRLSILQGTTENQMSEYGVLPYTPGIDRQISLCSYLLEHEIKPKIPANACDGINALKMYVEQWLCFIVTLVPMLLSIFILLNEQSHGQFKFLMQMPFSRTKQLMSKYTVIFLLTLASVIIISGLLFILCSSFFGVGDYAYPISKENGQYFSTGTLLLNSFPSAVCSVLFFTSLGVLVSVCSPREVVGVICSVIVSALIMILQSTVQNSAYWIPFFSQNVFEIMSTTDLPVPFICGIQIVSSAGLLWLSHLMFRKKDFA